MKSKMAFKLGLASILGALVLGTGCAGSAPPGATAADAARAHTSIAALDQGRSLFMAHCGACHAPPSPSSQPVSAWPGHVDEMQIRAHLTPQEASLVKQYLVTMAAR
jgi:mono/diheme cytochrome c family protein